MKAIKLGINEIKDKKIKSVSVNYNPELPPCDHAYKEHLILNKNGLEFNKMDYYMDVSILSQNTKITGWIHKYGYREQHKDFNEFAEKVKNILINNYERISPASRREREEIVITLTFDDKTKYIKTTNLLNSVVIQLITLVDEMIPSGFEKPWFCAAKDKNEKEVEVSF